MNQWIQELAEQAISNVRFWKTEKESYVVDQDELAEFAELIIRECATIVYLCSHADCSGGDEFIHAGDKIKKHFGVE